jgi:hypothetical protein
MALGLDRARRAVPDFSHRRAFVCNAHHPRRVDDRRSRAPRAVAPYAAQPRATAPRRDGAGKHVRHVRFRAKFSQDHWDGFGVWCFLRHRAQSASAGWVVGRRHSLQRADSGDGRICAADGEMERKDSAHRFTRCASDAAPRRLARCRQRRFCQRTCRRARVGYSFADDARRRALADVAAPSARCSARARRCSR